VSGKLGSLVLTEGKRPRLLENWVLTKVFGPKGEKVTGNCRKLRYEELFDLCTLQHIICVISSRRIRWEWHVAHMEEGRNTYT
jgi:hypothetical protein